MDILNGLYISLNYCLLKEYVIADNKVLFYYLVFGISYWKCRMANGSYNGRNS